MTSFPATLEHLEAARAGLARSLPEEWQALAPKIELALDELWANIINHAYDPDRPGRIEVEGRPAEMDDQAGFLVRLRDWGRPFDPFSQAPEPDISSDLASRPIGGLGIHLVKSLARYCGYQRLGDCNQVELFFDPED
jgi:anti-sigma regulatory factor (Ser/Thr protein kinase)